MTPTPLIVTVPPGLLSLARPDLVEVRRALAVLADPSSGCELRGLPSGRSRVLSGGDLDGLAAAAGELSDDRGVYYCLNPVPPDLGRAARVGDVLRRRWLLLDIDPVKPADHLDSSATPDEHEAARGVALKVMDHLSGLGWPAPVLVDSGNGWHLLYRIDLPADSDSQVLLRRFLAVLAQAFDDPAAGRIDRAVHNASRIAKLPGTWARKGADTPERPHRLCRLVFAPESPSIAGADLIEAVASSRDSRPPPATSPGSGSLVVTAHDAGPEAYARAALERECGRMALTPPGGRNDQLFKSAAALGNFVGPGLLDGEAITGALTTAAHVAGCDNPAKDSDTIRRGLEAGRLTPRDLSGLNGAPATPPGGPDPGAVESEIEIPRWPDPLAPEAYHGVFGRVVRAVEPHTEADPVAVLAQLLVGFGSLCGRHSFVRVESARHFPNLFACLVGRSSRARKGTSWRRVQAGLSGADSSGWAERVQSGLSSGEGLVWAVRDRVVRSVPVRQRGRITGYQEEVVAEEVADKRLLVVEEEFSRVLAMGRREGNILADVIRVAWDTGRLRSLVKNCPAQATDAHIAVIGHITQHELLRRLEDTDAHNGFLNRFLWFCVKRSKLLPHGGGQPDFSSEARDLADAAELASGHEREILMDADSLTLWRSEYARLTADRPGLAGLVTSRAEAQALRLALIYALADGDACIRPEHLQAALAVERYVAQSAAYIFGPLTGDSLADEVEVLLRDHPGGLTQTALYHAFQRNKGKVQIEAALRQLLQAGRASWQRPVTNKPGPRPIVWRLLSGAVTPTNSYE
jgi:hypothetical protein